MDDTSLSQMTPMYHQLFRSVPERDLHLDGASTLDGVSKLDDSNDILLNSATSLLQRSYEAPKRSRLDSSKFLCWASLVLHPTLVALHLGLVGIWAKGLEHRVTFSLDNQATVSFAVTAVTTTFTAVHFLLEI
ncbi:hypothetical protein C8R44DRAFT_250750 [Mycena epipterygia]|nr:hypothetical protein C8R44DRAFT_250750 [Mycena epipterygia]